MPFSNLGQTLNVGGPDLPLGRSTFTPKEPLDPDLLHWYKFDDSLVDEITKEPDYAAALDAVKQL